MKSNSNNNANNNPNCLYSFFERISPEATTGCGYTTWLLINMVCLIFSIYLGIYNLWINKKKGNAEAEEEEEVIVTIEYLIWSLSTTVIWIVEVALRAIYPPHQHQQNQQIEDDDNTDDDAVLVYKQQHDDDDDDDDDLKKPNQQQSQEGGGGEIEVPSQSEQQHQQHTQRISILMIELILALFFLIESIVDCIHWKKSLKESDFVSQEIDIWMNTIAYTYMTYETYKLSTATTVMVATPSATKQKQHQPSSSSSSSSSREWDNATPILWT
jgi:hypothetical protein